MSGISNFGPEMTPVWTQSDGSVVVEIDRSNNQVNFGSPFGVEEVFKAAHLHEANGWTVEINKDSDDFSPSLTVFPKLGPSALTVEQRKMLAEPDCSCCHCYSPREKGWRTYSLKEAAGVELLTFRYRPHLCCCCCCNSDRITEVFIPQKTERIGWIDSSNDFRVGSTLTDCITGAVFVVSSSVRDGSTIIMTISRSDNNAIVAICKATQGTREHNRHGSWIEWTGFEMEYFPAMATTTLSSRAVLLVAFQMSVLMYKEKECRCQICWSPLVLIFLIIVIIRIVFWIRNR